MTSETLYSLLITIGRASGIGAFFLLGLTIFIGGSARLFKKAIKLGTLLKLHERLSYIAYFILIIHPLLVLTAKVVDGSSLLDFFAAYIGYPPLVVGLVIFLTVTITIFAAFFKKLVKRFIWLNMMRVSVVAHLAVLYHLFNLGSLSGPYGSLPLLNLVIAASVLLSIGGVCFRLLTLLQARR